MSGVKNLRAMFEQKGDTSPPDRGRSPGIPTNTAASTESPRPLSKVRTSFIAITKDDGRIGLQRKNSQDSSFSSTRKFSGETDTASPAAVVEKSNVFADNMAATTTKTSLKDQPIPESPHSGSNVVHTVPLAKTSHGPNTQAWKAVPVRLAGAGLTSVSLDGAADEALASTSSAVSRETEPSNGTASGKERDKVPSKDATKPTTKAATRTTPKPLTVPNTSKTGTKPAKSPTVAKAPKSPATTSTPNLPAKTPERTTMREQASTPKPTIGTPKAPRSSSVKRPPPLQPSPAGTGFVKPKPKSPTRPVRLPPGLTTHTAASGSKVNVPRQTLSRASGATHHGESLGRSPSGASMSTPATSATKPAESKSLKRQSSTINRPRPSLGPPPKQPAKDHPPIKKDKEVDESFLARMMRPTRASSSKTAEKLVTTPPRKPALAPVIKVAAKAESSNQHGAADKPDTNPNAVGKYLFRSAGEGASSSSQNQQNSAANRIAGQVEQVATAEKAIEIAKDNEGEIPLSPGTSQKSSAETVAAIAEQSTTAEEAISAAKMLDGEITPPKSPLLSGEHEKSAGNAPKNGLDVKWKEVEQEVSLESANVNGRHEEEPKQELAPASVVGESADTPDAKGKGADRGNETTID